jgi:hypothetical protein
MGGGPFSVTVGEGGCDGDGVGSDGVGVGEGLGVGVGEPVGVASEGLVGRGTREGGCSPNSHSAMRTASVASTAISNRAIR